MGNNGNKDVIGLWGHDFTRAKYGLDEKQVVLFVNELFRQRDALLHRQKHLSSLTKLAERTIAEADNIAHQIKGEAIAQADTDVKAIMAKAEEQAQRLIEEKRAEAIAQANREAEAIRGDAQQQAQLLMVEKASNIQIELLDMSQSLHNQLLSQLENLQQQVATLEKSFEQILPQTMKQFNLDTEKERPSQHPVPLEPENNANLGTDTWINTQPENSLLDELTTQDQVVNPPANSEPEATATISVETETAIYYTGEVELEIRLPLDIRQIMGIMRHLDSLAEIETTELIPATNGPSIIVFLRETVPLIEILKTFPEVSQAEEATGEENSRDGDNRPSQRRVIQITLAKDRVLVEAKKEALTSEAVHIPS